MATSSELATVLAGRSLSLASASLAGECNNVLNEYSISSEQLADAIEVVMQSVDSTTVTKGVIDAARQALAKSARGSSTRAEFKTPHNKQPINRSNASLIPGYNASSVSSSGSQSAQASASARSSSAMSSFSPSSQPLSGVKRPAAPLSSSASSSAKSSKIEFSSVSVAGGSSGTPTSAGGSSAKSSSASPASAVAEFESRKNQGTELDSYNANNPALASTANAWARLSVASLKAAGYRTFKPLSRLDNMPGRLPVAAASWSSSAAAFAAPVKLAPSDPLPLVCASVQRWADVTGLRIGLPPVPQSSSSSSAAAALTRSSSSPSGISSGSGSSGPVSPAQQQQSTPAGSPSQSTGAAVAASVSPASGGGAFSALSPTTSPTAAAATAAAIAGPDAAAAVTGEDARSFDAPEHRNADVPFKYMFTTLDDRAEALEGRLAEVGDAIVAAHGLEALVVPAGTTSQAPVVVVGRICVDGEGKINPSSVLLEGSNAHGPLPSARLGRIHLDLREVPSFSLFPGQIVAAKGMCTRGDTLIVSELFVSAATALPVMPGGNAGALADAFSRADSGPLRIWAAAGPFTLHADLAYSPLEVLLAEARDAQPPPDVLILMGPFVETEHPSFKSRDAYVTSSEGKQVPVTYTSLWHDTIAVLLDDYLSNEPNLSRMHLVLMPSSLDAISQPVYPQWPLQPSDLKNISESLRKRTTVLPNPATFVVGGVVIGGTSTDVLFQLNAEDTMRQPAAAGGGAQRMEKLPRMAQHLIEQRSYFPMFPAPRPEETPLELSQLWHVGMPMTPDVILLPSRLKPFSKPIGAGTLVINPGPLVKQNTGGTYAKICVHPQTRAGFVTYRVPSSSSTPDDAKAESEEPRDYVATNVAARATVQVVRI